MSAGLQKKLRNIILRSLRPGDFALISPHCERITLPPLHRIFAVDQPIHFLYFPETAIVAVCDAQQRAETCLTALVGCDGFVGWPMLMDCPRSPQEIRTGRERSWAIRIAVAPLLLACTKSRTLEVSLLKYVQVLMVQMGSTIISGKTDPIERRIARLILMHHDRRCDDEICVTHQDMAAMLAIRRASVTDALHVMEGERMIASSRNKITVRDRTALCRVVGTSYGQAEAYYRQSINPAESWK